MVSIPEIEKIRKIPIVFILGIGRSGTTLLQSLLNSHPNIIAPPESQFIAFLYSRFKRIKHWNNKDISKFVNDLFIFPKISEQWLLNEKDIYTNLLSIKNNADYQLLCKMVFWQMREEKQNILILSDKNPLNSVFISKLLKIFPDARFIHMVRDPRDVVNGFKKRLKKKNVYFVSWQWLKFNISIEAKKEKIPSQFHSLKYEDMVSNTEETLTSLCKFLKVPFEHSMLQNHFSEKLQKYRAGESLEAFKRRHENLLRPINASNIGKWKQELTETDKLIVEQITGTYARTKYGYTIDMENNNASHISPFKIFTAKIRFYRWKFFMHLRFDSQVFNSLYVFIKKTFNTIEKNG